jgi:hypothetical protein
MLHLAPLKFFANYFVEIGKELVDFYRIVFNRDLSRYYPSSAEIEHRALHHRKALNGEIIIISIETTKYRFCLIYFNLEQ